MATRCDECLTYYPDNKLVEVYYVNQRLCQLCVNSLINDMADGLEKLDGSIITKPHFTLSTVPVGEKFKFAFDGVNNWVYIKVESLPETIIVYEIEWPLPLSHTYAGIDVTNLADKEVILYAE